MRISKWTTRLGLMSLSFGVLISLVVGFILQYALPQFYPIWYSNIAYFFIILETLLICTVSEVGLKVSSRRMVNVYMLVKVIKILLSLVFVVVYALVVKEEIKNFVIVFIVFYLLYLLIETYSFSQIEKQIKKGN